MNDLKKYYLPYLSKVTQKRIEKICGKHWRVMDIPAYWRKMIERGKVEKSQNC